MKPTEFIEALAHASTGHEILYHVGHLARDRDLTVSPTMDSVLVGSIGDMAFLVSSETGLNAATPLQRRIGEGASQYLLKMKRPLGKREVEYLSRYHKKILAGAKAKIADNLVMLAIKNDRRVAVYEDD